MFIGLIYLVAFSVGVFIVWYFGKAEYLSEEKLIDLSLISTVAAVFSARWVFFLTPLGQIQIQQIVAQNNFCMIVFQVLRLNLGMMGWVGVLVYFLVAVYLLWKWQWPYWPTLGILTLGGTVSLAIGLAVYLTIDFSILTLSYLITTISSAILVLYVYRFGGDRLFQDFAKGFRRAYRERVKPKADNEPMG